MGVYWLEAEEAVGGAVARSYSRGVYDWPSLSMAGFQGGDLAALWAFLHGASDGRGAATGESLASDPKERTSVARVNPEFVRRLAALEAPDLERAAAEWLKCEGLVGLPKESAETVLRE